MKVFVTGGTGAIGQPAVSALVAAGHQVTALSRSDVKSDRLGRQGAPPVQVSLFDRERLAQLFAGHDAIVNLASVLPATRDFAKYGAWAENIRIRTEGSATVVVAALEAGATAVQESVCMIYRDHGAEWIDEAVPR